MMPQSSQGHQKSATSATTMDTPLSQHIQQAPWFSQLLIYIRQMQHLQYLFASVCDSQLAQQCQVATLKNDTLYIHVSSTSWATRLRYCTSELIKALQGFEEFKSIKALKILIRTPDKKINATHAPIPISQESATFLTQIANTIEDEALKEALLKLARTN